MESLALVFFAWLAGLAVGLVPLFLWLRSQRHQLPVAPAPVPSAPDAPLDPIVQAEAEKVFDRLGRDPRFVHLGDQARRQAARDIAVAAHVHLGQNRRSV